MTTLLILVPILVYLLVAVLSIVPLARGLRRMKCHDSYKWRSQVNCRKYDGPDCWRVDEVVTPAMVGLASAKALVWPVTFGVEALVAAANREPRSKRRLASMSNNDLIQRMAELERENGIGA